MKKFLTITCLISALALGGRRNIKRKKPHVVTVKRRHYQATHVIPYLSMSQCTFIKE